MRNIFILVRKEFLQIFRNRQLLPFMTVLPVIQVILLTFAANYEIKNLRLGIWDLDQSTSAQQLIHKFTGAKFFQEKALISNQKKADELLMKDEVDLVLVIPKDFEKAIHSSNNPAIQFQINALNNAKAGIVQNYASAITQDFLNEKRGNSTLLASPKIIPITNYWYNPTLNYKTIMLPGIVAEVMTLIIILICALNVVREREIGTIEQLNVTPLKKHEFILGKLIPFWVIGHFIFWAGIALGKIFFNIPMVGSLGLLELFLAIFLFVPLGIGLFISTAVETQQQALFTSFFFIILFILMCGLFTPVETMPDWAQYINQLNPLKYFVEVNRLILLKGSGLKEIYPFIAKMIIYGIGINLLAIWRFKKTN
ncbi:ABC transporter permease [Aquirufa echingensis]|uniref:ABC transporter permease n=1 Tax=Aquirufa echingensis TaxID=3096516 RepID=A0ABW6CXL0_9BACT